MDFRKRRLREEPEINLIPFIDVLLVILIFLMVTTTYSKYSELQIALPSADGTKMLERPLELNISVDAQGNYAINEHRIDYVSPVQLAQQMRNMVPGGKGGQEPVVIISADGNAPHQRIINVMEAARLAGMDKLTFATQTTEK